MKTVKEIISISIVPSIFLLNGCASDTKIVSVSDTHFYNEQYGIVEDPQADAKLKEELVVQNKPTEVEIPKSNDPSIYTGLKPDPEAVTADKLVEVPPVITYKYKFDPVFYTENQIANR
jgi:hypothetical protein